MTTKLSIDGSGNCFIRLEFKGENDTKIIKANYDGTSWSIRRLSSVIKTPSSIIRKTGNAETILALHKTGVTQKDISEQLSIHKSWVSRVIKRNLIKNMPISNQI